MTEPRDTPPLGYIVAQQTFGIVIGEEQALRRILGIPVLTPKEIADLRLKALGLP